MERTLRDMARVEAAKRACRARLRNARKGEVACTRVCTELAVVSADGKEG